MYKRRSQAMQHYHRVYEIDSQPVGYVTQDDLLPDLGHMNIAACEEERVKLIGEKNRAEQELLSAKQRRNRREIETLGCRIASFSQRLGLIKQRLKELRRANEKDALDFALKEMLDGETLHRVISRKREIIGEMLAGTWRPE